MSMLEIPEDVDISGQEEAVRVFVRIRPLNKRELAEKQTIGWNFNETSMLEDTPNGQRVYAYDHCFGPNRNNQETYEIVGKPVVLKAMEGYNGTVFTYGQTGSGKTWTMRGCESDPGMMVLCVRDILDWVKNHPDIQYKIKISYMEVYNEEINDLLSDQGPASKNLKIVSEDAVRGAVIGGLVEETAETAEDFMAILQRGEAARSYASTNMNSESSRSHTIYRVSIEAREKQAAGEEGEQESSSAARVSYLNLVDLAGSERQKSTKAEGKVLKEGANINKSLLALAAVINKLGDASKKVKGAKPAFIPYRDSKLTRILKQSLGGNTLTSILCAVTPAPMHREETVSTLKFGQTCKNIKNNVKSNDGVLDDKALIKQLRATIAEQRAQLDEMMSGDFTGRKGSGTEVTEILTREKAEAEKKVQALKAMLVTAGVSAADIANTLTSISTSSPSSDPNGSSPPNSDHYLVAELAKLNDKLAEQQKIIVKLQRKLGDYRDLEESKASLEEYEHHIRQELDELRNKLDEEKHNLQVERHKLLKDRSSIDEKESRIGLLITNLDEKESKLRQLMATMREQQEQWQRSITDLQRREDLVDDWQRNHKQREKKLLEIESLQEKKFQELNKREAIVLEDENKARLLNKELTEREQRLQISLSRITNMEVANSQKEEVLNTQEQTLKKRMNDCDIRERELASRRKELESWDVLLREKDRKILSEQRDLDDRETAMRALEEKNKAHEIENERKRMELKQEEASLQDMIEKYDKLNADMEEKEKDLKERDREYHALRKELSQREEELKKWEKQLMKLQEQMRGIEARERVLKSAEEAFKIKEDEFYNYKVAQITSRHNQELKAFEEIIQKQLKIVSEFQKELEILRSELLTKNQEMGELEAVNAQRAQIIEQLKEQLHRLESNPAAALLQQASVAATGGAGSANSNNGSSPTPPAVGALNTTGSGNGAEASSEVPGKLFPASPSPSDGMLGSTSSVPSPPFAIGGAVTGPAGMPGVSPTNGLGAHEHDRRMSSVLSSANLTSKLHSLHQFIGPASGAMGGHPTDFLTQLATTRNLIYQVLDKFDAVPDGKSPLAQRKLKRSTSTEKKQQAEREQGDEAVGVMSGQPIPVARRRNNIASPETLAGLQDARREVLGGTSPPPPPQSSSSLSPVAGYASHAASGSGHNRSLYPTDAVVPPQIVLEAATHPPHHAAALTTAYPAGAGGGEGVRRSTTAPMTSPVPPPPPANQSPRHAGMPSALSPMAANAMGSVPPGAGIGARRAAGLSPTPAGSGLITRLQSSPSLLGSQTAGTSGLATSGSLVPSSLTRKSAIKGGLSPAPANASSTVRSPVPGKPSNNSGAAPTTQSGTSAQKKSGGGVGSNGSSSRLFGQDLAGIVSSGDADEFGIPITVVNLNKRTGIKKFVESMH